MYFRFRGLRPVFWALPKIYPGTVYQFAGAGANVSGDARLNAAWFNATNSLFGRLDLNAVSGRAFSRYSTVSGIEHSVLPTTDVLSFLQSALHQPKGPSHCWLNATPGRNSSFKGDEILLVLVIEYLEGFEANQNTVKMLEIAKLLQQRNPSLQVMALQHGTSICLDDISSHLLQIIKEYITFPILLSNKNISELKNVPSYIISKGFQNPIIYPGEDADLKILDKAIHDLNTENGMGDNVGTMKRAWVKRIEVAKEPDVCSASRNLLFAFPGCISVDGSGNRLFLSDANHHRIIVFNSNGKILDAIGSSPGFEDGEFEMAKLTRPAASFYDSSEDCLYFVDSENHAVRRADMERRVVETVFPVTNGGKKGIWKTILDKIWTKRSIKLKSEELNFPSLLFPWHLMKSSDNDIFILNQSFGTLWIVDLESGFIREVVKEPSRILEICGQMILERCTPLRHLPAELLQQQIDSNFSLEGIPYGGLMSSVATWQDHVVFCDTVGQALVKFSNGSGSATTFRLSNFRILGLPYWLTFSLEKVYAVNDPSELGIDHIQCFRLLPGRVDIELNVDIPEHADLVEQPQEGCIWRQARGAAAEISGVGNTAVSSEKVSSTQQWYDGLDNLIYEEEDESTGEEDICPPGEESQGRVRIGCTINTSPGTSEVIIYAALYLRLKKNSNSQDDGEGIKAGRIAEMLEPKRKDLLVQLLMMSNRDLEEVVFTRPVHVRLKFNCDDHPKGDHSKEVVLTDSSVKVHVTL
ncbi:hypothetical protein ACS0TY_007931 [Phlomoides rotata]